MAIVRYFNTVKRSNAAVRIQQIEVEHDCMSMPVREKHFTGSAPQRRCAGVQGRERSGAPRAQRRSATAYQCTTSSVGLGGKSLRKDMKTGMARILDRRRPGSKSDQRRRVGTAGNGKRRNNPLLGKRSPGSFAVCRRPVWCASISVVGPVRDRIKMPGASWVKMFYTFIDD